MQDAILDSSDIISSKEESFVVVDYQKESNPKKGGSLRITLIIPWITAEWTY